MPRTRLTRIPNHAVAAFLFLLLSLIAAFTYDARGQLAAMQDPLGRHVTMQWEDVRGRLVRLVDKDGAVWHYTYGDKGELTEIQRPDKRTEQFIHDERGLPVLYIDAKGGRKRWQYNELGQITEYTDCSSQSTRYEYDRWEQLARIIQANGSQTEYTLDSATQAFISSRTQHAQEGYIKDNLVRVFEDKRFFYDGHGRLIKKLSGKHTDQRFQWNEENRLIEVVTTRRSGTEHQTTQSTRFDYDALGRRIAKHDSFGTTSFIWEGMRLIEERWGASVISYVYEPGSYVPLARLDARGKKTEQGGLGTQDDEQPPPAREGGDQEAASKPQARPISEAEQRYWAALDATAQQKAQELQIKGWGTGTDGPNNRAKICDVYYFHTDQVGLPEELSNNQGNLVWRASYKTWGNTVTEDWSVVSLYGAKVDESYRGDTPKGDAKQQNLRFQGQYLDRDTGLHYNTFRYYDPDIGRFISPDPIGLNGGINLGSYSPNPISWIDPWGWVYDVSAKTAGTDALSRGVHVNVHGAGLPAGGGHVSLVPNPAYGVDGNTNVPRIVLEPADAATRNLSPSQWNKVQADVKSYLDNPKNVNKMIKAAQAGVDAYPNTSRSAQMAAVRDHLTAAKKGMTNPCR